jgi:hypothetical protein
VDTTIFMDKTDESNFIAGNLQAKDMPLDKVLTAACLPVKQ